MGGVKVLKQAAAAQSGEPGVGSFQQFRQGELLPRMRLTIRLVLVARRYRALLDEKLRAARQSSARMEAMSVILGASTPRPQVEIARRLRIEGPTLTRMLDTLEKDGLVERLPDPADRRTKQLRITPAGERALEETFGIADDLRQRLLEDFSDEDIATIDRFLEKLLDRLDNGLRDDE